jgi:hypothetical protein
MNFPYSPGHFACGEPVEPSAPNYTPFPLENSQFPKLPIPSPYSPLLPSRSYRRADENGPPRALVGILPAAGDRPYKKSTKNSKFSGKNLPGRTLYTEGQRRPSGNHSRSKNKVLFRLSKNYELRTMNFENRRSQLDMFDT